jgi:nucleoside-diphosphate-sugar epimerase
MVVRVLVAGGSGALGRRLVPQLVARGHQVTATTTSAGKLGLTLDVLDGQIQTIRSVSNPDKLGHVGPVADAWTVAREVNRACRPTD